MPLLPLHVASSSSLISPSTTTSYMRGGLAREGLSKYHQAILSRMATDRQRFVSGKYPVICQVTEQPTLKWLGRGKALATCQLMINGTSVDRSVASYDRFQWLDDKERNELHDKYSLFSWELLAVISITKPGYVNVLPGNGAGSTSASLRFLESTSRWDRWKLNGLVLDELEERVCRDRLWVTGFSLTGREGLLSSIDTNTGHMESVNKRTAKSLLWPNEASSVPAQFYNPPTIVNHNNERLRDASVHVATKPTSTTLLNTNIHASLNDLKDAVLVSDGFLVPGKDRGGIYVVNQPGNPNSEWNTCLTNQKSDDRWFYHRAVWVDVTGDGRKSILTARAKFPLGSTSRKNGSPQKPTCGQLVCLEMPKPYRIDESTGTPLEKDGTVFDPLSSRHLPWKVHVLDEGPDVMFNVVDMDESDDTIEVIASQFFGEKVTLHSIQRGETPKVTFKRTIDTMCGKAFGCIVADLDVTGRTSTPVTIRRVIDAGSTVATLQPGDHFTHLLVTSHECSFREEPTTRKSVFNRKEVDKSETTQPTARTNSSIDGGSLFAYRVPEGCGKWRTEEWARSTVGTGFKVHGQLNNMINPGAPGFVYTFHARLQDKAGSEKKRPLIAVAGDCAESAYVFRPAEMDEARSGDGNNDIADASARYDLMCEIKCGATVGSIGVGYAPFCESELEQESSYAKLYIPCYEDDKILVFALGSGED